MNNRFRFRAWHKPSKRMFEVHCFTAEEVFENTLDGVGTSHTNPANMNDCVLMQNTGLKDKNGRLIYEGDILKDHRQEGGIVKWNNDSAGFAIYEILETGFCVGGLFDWLDKDTNYEVVGNIHEGPKLLDANK